MSYVDNPRTCSACGCRLFPNYMEGCWEHFEKNGCKFQGMSSVAVLKPQYNPSTDEMLGQFVSERESRAGEKG